MSSHLPKARGEEERPVSCKVAEIIGEILSQSLILRQRVQRAANRMPVVAEFAHQGGFKKFADQQRRRNGGAQMDVIFDAADFMEENAGHVDAPTFEIMMDLGFDSGDQQRGAAWCAT